MLIRTTSHFFIHQFIVGTLQTNTYFLIEKSSKKVIIIDPGDDGDFLSEQIISQELSPILIFFTHGHFDHVGGGLPLFLNFPDLPIFLSVNDQNLYNRANSTAFHFTGRSLDPIIPFESIQNTTFTLHFILNFNLPSSDYQLMPFPGHTKGSAGLYFSQDKILFSGDLIFSDGGTGRTDFAYSSSAELNQSLKLLRQLDPDSLVCPGHGPAFTLGNFTQSDH